MPEIEQPKFDELAVGDLADVEETGEAIIEDAHYKGIAKLGTTVGTYWVSLRTMGLPPEAATRLTREWMNICAWPSDEE